MLSKNRETLRRFVEVVWNQGELDAIGRFLAEAYEIRHDPGDPWDGQTLDAAGLRERVRLSRAPFPDQRFTIVEMTGEGDKVAMFWTWRGTHLGQISGYAPFGKVVTMSGATLYYFDKGKLCGHWQVVDRLSVFLQLQSKMKTS